MQLRRDGMVLIAATTTDTDCTYYFALALQRDAASEIMILPSFDA